MLTIPAYFAVKLAGYSMWCLVALRLAGGRAPGEVGRAAVYGILRIVIGLVLGVSLVWIMPSLAPAANRAHFSIPVYVGALGILRIFEWIAVGGAIGMDMGLGRLAGPLGPLWVAGGVAISFLTDAVVIAFGIAVYDMPC